MSSRCFSNTMLALNTVNSSVLSARRVSAELLKQSYHMQFVINSSRLSCEHQPDEFSVHPVCPWNRPSVHHYTDDMMLHPLTSVQLFVASLLQSFNHICSFASWLRWRFWLVMFWYWVLVFVCVCVLCFSGGDRADDRAVPAEAEGAAGGRVQGGRAERPAGGAEEQQAGASSSSSSSPQHLLHGWAGAPLPRAAGETIRPPTWCYLD